MDKKLIIDVDLTEKYSLSGAAGIPMSGNGEEISNLDDLKKLIDRLLDSKDLEITGTIKGFVILNGEPPNTAV